MPMASSDTASPEPEERGPRPMTVLIALGIAVLVLLAASAFLPRWWAHRIGNQADGSFTNGIGLGLFYGFTLTLLALALLLVGLRRIHSWKGRLILLGVAVLLASPNLITLGIVLGPGDGAHAGERTLDVEAPGFRSSSLIGAIVAVLLLLGIWILFRSRRHAKEESAQLRDERDRRDGVHAP
jgi:MFS family permease